MPQIQMLCQPTPQEPWGATTQTVGPHDVKFATLSGADPEGQLNGLLAMIAAEQKARAHIQRKLMMLSELQRTLEDYKTHFARATVERKDTEQRLQAIRPQLERERRSREEAERELREKRAQIEDLVKRLDDANEKILVARKFQQEIQNLKTDLETVRKKRDRVREELRAEQSLVDAQQATLNAILAQQKSEKQSMVSVEAQKQNRIQRKDELTTSKNDITDELQHLEKDSIKLNAEKKHLEKQYKDATDAHSKAEKGGEDFQKNLLNAENDKMKKDQDYRDQERNRDQLEKEVKEKLDKIRNLEEELAVLQKTR